MDQACYPWLVLVAFLVGVYTVLMFNQHFSQSYTKSSVHTWFFRRMTFLNRYMQYIHTNISSIFLFMHPKCLALSVYKVKWGRKTFFWSPFVIQCQKQQDFTASIERYQGGSPTIDAQLIRTASICWKWDCCAIGTACVCGLLDWKWCWIETKSGLYRVKHWLANILTLLSRITV